MVRSHIARSMLALGSLAALAGCQPATTMEATEPGEEPQENSPEEITESEAPSATGDAVDDAAPEGSGGVADGTYRASGGYQSPNGPETIEVSITLTDGVVEAVEVIPGATNSTSKRYQGDFAGGIGAEVVGKSLDEANVTRVAGSSLTSGGFDEALQTIRHDAKVG